MIECDASSSGVGAVLLQEGKPIAYLSKALAPKHLGLSACEKELMAAAIAVQKWRPYLVGRHFKIITDHLSLKYLLEQRNSIPVQQKWLTKLERYNYEIIYRSGNENVAMVALSRLYEIIMTLSFPVADWLALLQDEWKRDEKIQQIIQEIVQNSMSHSKFSYVNEQLKFKGRLWLGS